MDARKLFLARNRNLSARRRGQRWIRLASNLCPPYFLEEIYLPGRGRPSSPMTQRCTRSCHLGSGKKAKTPGTVIAIPAVAQQDRQHLCSIRTQVRSPARHGGYRLWRCCSCSVGHSCGSGLAQNCTCFGVAETLPRYLKDSNFLANRGTGTWLWGPLNLASDRCLLGTHGTNPTVAVAPPEEAGAALRLRPMEAASWILALGCCDRGQDKSPRLTGAWQRAAKCAGP